MLLFATSKDQLQKMLCGFEESTEKSVTQDPRRKDENSQQPEQPLSGLEKRSANRRKREMLKPVDYIPATGNDRNQESYQDSLGDVSQIQAGADIEKLLAQTPSPTVSTQQYFRRYAMHREHEHPRKSVKE